MVRAPVRSGSQLDREIEVLGPELDERRIGGPAGAAAQRQQHIGHERVPVGEERSRWCVDGERLAAELMSALDHHQLRALHAHLLAVTKHGRAESARRRAQSDLPGCLA